jgi:hypothetical protein
MREWLGRRAAGVVCCAAVWGGASTAHAEPFRHPDLFVGHTIKASAGDRTFSAGLNFQVAPVDTIERKLVQAAVDKAEAANPAAKPVIEAMKNITPEQMQLLKDVANSGQIEAFKQKLIDQAAASGHPLPPEAKAQLDKVGSSDLKTLVAVIEVMQKPPAPALTFSVDPYVTLQFWKMALRAQIAIAGWNTDSGNNFEFGNVGLGAEAGDSYGTNGAAFGWTAGCDVWLPTGTKNADVIAKANLLAAPRYLHSYLTFAPYAVAGGEIGPVSVMLRGQWVRMQPKVDVEATVFQDKLTDMGYFTGGLAARLDAGFMAFSVELDTLQEVENAPAMDNVWLGTFGVRGQAGPVHLGAAVQAPLKKPAEATHSFGGVGMGSVASVNFLANAGLHF